MSEFLQSVLVICGLFERIGSLLVGLGSRLINAVDITLLLRRTVGDRHS